MKYLLLIFFMLVFKSSYSQLFDVSVAITDIRKIKGNIEIGVFNNMNAFPKDGKQYKSISCKVNAYSETIIIRSLPKGEYALAIFHDENSDGKCNRNLLGIPKEGYGFTNNYKPVIKAPSFDNCRIYLVRDTLLKIKLIY